jgi:2,4-diaminopentanoate dehydrogenase
VAGSVDVTIRVYQWASGTVGRAAALEVLRRPGLELMGLHVRTPGKAGRDAGSVLGTGALGFAATADRQAVIDSNADVVVHAPLPSLVYGDHEDQDLDDICALLAAGKHVITVVGYLYPPAHPPAVQARLAEACATGGSTFHSTGLNPGWMGDLLPVLMSALCGRIDRVVVREISNFQHYPSPEIMFASMGFALPEDEFHARSARRSRWLNGLFGESIRLVADGAGLDLDAVQQSMEIALAPADLDTASGTVPRGTVAGQHWTWWGSAGRETRVVHETVWRMHASVAPEWPRGAHEVVVEGVPRLRLSIGADWVSDGLVATAMHAVNAIEPVCRAGVGIRTLLDLPLPRRRPG